MKKLAIAFSLAAGLTLAAAARAEETPGKSPDYCRADGEPPAETSVTRHHFAAGGQRFDYDAAAGTLVIRGDNGEPSARIGYIAYTRSDPKQAPAQRPLIFAFNGGPGSSSLMLHMGLLGPKRALVADPDAPAPPPYALVDNAFGMLDKADVVMIDPMGTGLSRTLCGRKMEEFLGVDPDADSVSRFIARYLSDNRRWTAPKYLMGESYGTIRAAVVANHMLAHYALRFNGVVMVSLATDLQILSSGLRSNERPYPLFLPGFAAVAWYHHLVSGQPALEPFLDEVRKFAAGPYTSALLKGDTLPEAERDAIAVQMHKYTGLSEDYIKTADLRISEFAFGAELFRSRRQTVSRLDGRFVGLALDPLQRNADYDPALAEIVPTYSAVLRDYLRRDLKLASSQDYITENRWVGDHFDMHHQPTGGQYGGNGPGQSYINAGDDLAQALVQEPNLHVLVLAGYFDLGSPFSTAEHMVAHLGVPNSAAARVRIQYYPSGHMIYASLPALKKLKRDLDAFIDTTR